MMMTCRLLCALLVLALCWLPVRMCDQGVLMIRTILPPPLRPQRRRPQLLPPRLPLRRQTTTNDYATTTLHKHQLRPRRPLHKHQLRHHYHGGAKHYDYRGANYEEPPAHRHFFAKLTAVPAATAWGLCPLVLAVSRAWLTAVCA
ncbi:putative mucin TcMUCI, partial [Trypanosoma cruzi]